MACSFSKAKFGVPEDEAGIIIESIDFSYKSDKLAYADLSGNTAGLNYFDDIIEITVNGLIPKTTPFDDTIICEWTLANDIPNHLPGGVSGGVLVLETVDINMNVKDFQKISLKGTLYPHVVV